jgi:putative peptide zinc metalloprotease protein
MSAIVKLAPGVVIHPEVVDGAADRVVELPDGRLVRVGADTARLLDAVADSGAASTVEHLARRLGVPWTPGLVSQTSDRLDALGITGNGRPSSARRLGRLEYRAPMSLQLTLTRRPVPGPRVLTRRWPAVAALLLALAGLPVLGAALAPESVPLHRPATLGTYVLVLIAILATVAVHELAHGAVLAAHGGRPRRFGAMLFYLTPAFFCDVTDAWRLAPAARVRVALAGIAVQSALAGTAALASLVASGAAQQGLLYYALAGYLVGLANLVPFLKLDGYIALAGGLDVSHLRARSMRDFRSWLAGLLFGARVERELGQLDWARWFGAACTVVPVVVVIVALKTLGAALAPLGVAGAVAILALAGAMAFALVRAVARFVGDARRAGAGRARTVGVLAALLAAVAAALAAVEVPRTYHGGYALVDGRPTAVLALAAPPEVLRAGGPVRLRRAGILPGATIGGATITGRPRRCDAPLETLAPIRGRSITLRAICAPISLPRDAPPTGRLSVRETPRPAAAWLAELAVGPALRTLGITTQRMR